MSKKEKSEAPKEAEAKPLKETVVGSVVVALVRTNPGGGEQIRYDLKISPLIVPTLLRKVASDVERAILKGEI